MNDRRVSGWARPFVDDEPINVTPGKRESRNWERDKIQAMHDAAVDNKKRASKKAWRALVSGIALYVVSQTRWFPSPVHWWAFFGAIICGAIALVSWNAALTHRMQARIAQNYGAADDVFGNLNDTD